MTNLRTPISLFLNPSRIQIQTEFMWVPVLLSLLGPRSFSPHFLSLSPPDTSKLFLSAKPMDLPPEELQFLTIPDLLRETTSIPKQSPKTFYLITLTLVFPLSFAILAHSLFTHPLPRMWIRPLPRIPKFWAVATAMRDS